MGTVFNASKHYVPNKKKTGSRQVGKHTSEMSEDTVFTISHPRQLSALAPIAPTEHRNEEKLHNFVYHVDSSPLLSQSASHARTPRDAEPTYLTHAPRFSHHLCAAEAADHPVQIAIHLLLRGRSAPPGYALLMSQRDGNVNTTNWGFG